jgi:NADH-quinone oxidoreductase subunit J
MVLFLFVVMMLDINFDKLREGFWQHLPIAATVAVLMVGQMALLLAGKAINLKDSAAIAPAAGASNTRELGRILYTDYLLPFELAAVVLLVAMVAAIALTLRARKEVKTQVIGDQVRVKSTDRLKIIKMDAVAKEPPAETTEAEPK